MHDIALIDVVRRKRIEERTRLFADFGPSSPALTTRRDQKIRFKVLLVPTTWPRRYDIV